MSAGPSRLAPPKLTRANPIHLHVAGDKCYVWDIEDVKALRVDHHICGVLVGTLPQVAQQNIFLGLPLQLLPEEVAILVSEREHHANGSTAILTFQTGLAVLVDDAKAHHPATSPEAEEYGAQRLQSVRSYQMETIRLEDEKREKMKQVYQEQIERRRQEKAAKRKQLEQAEDSQGTDTSSRQEANTESDSLESRLAKTVYSIVTPGSSSDSPWYDATDETVHTTLGAARRAGLLHYPNPLETVDCARVEIFRDLWKKGYYMGIGLKFGGDFLVYPGDPLRFHSHFTLTVLGTPTQDISPLDIVSWGRLATAVKKAHLIGSWDAAAEKAEYISLEWAGFG